jgi:hypothetical protein
VLHVRFMLLPYPCIVLFIKNLLKKTVMKKVSMKIAMVALMVIVGTVGVQAQNGKGTGICTTGTGTASTILTPEQVAILEALSAEYQDAMDVLRAALLATTDVAEIAAIRAEMKDLRIAHQDDIKALLVSWGVSNPMAGKKNAGTLAKGGKGNRGGK